MPKRVLIVDDSRLMREYVKGMLEESGEFQVVGEAEDGMDALQKVKVVKPDVVLMDVIMPRMNGLEATKRIMEKYPVPILIFSSTVEEKDVEYAYNAVKMGAVDVMAKPDSSTIEEDEFRKEFIRRLKIVSNVSVLRRRGGQRKKVASPAKVTHTKEVFAIGASTGGPAAVSFVLQKMSSGNFFVLIIQHMAKGFDRGFVNWLRGETGWDVRLVEEGMRIRNGVVYVAPSGYHTVLKGRKLYLDDSPPVKSCKPSIDVGFRSVAEEYGRRVLGAIRTGIGDDGVEGCRSIKEKGGYIIAQDETSSVVYGMPRAALEAKVVDTVLSLDKIPELAGDLLKD